MLFWCKKNPIRIIAIRGETVLFHSKSEWRMRKSVTKNCKPWHLRLLFDLLPANKIQITQ